MNRRSLFKMCGATGLLGVLGVKSKEKVKVEPVKEVYGGSVKIQGCRYVTFQIDEAGHIIGLTHVDEIGRPILNSAGQPICSPCEPKPILDEGYCK